MTIVWRHIGKEMSVDDGDGTYFLSPMCNSVIRLAGPKARSCSQPAFSWRELLGSTEGCSQCVTLEPAYFFGLRFLASSTRDIWMRKPATYFFVAGPKLAIS